MNDQYNKRTFVPADYSWGMKSSSAETAFENSYEDDDADNHDGLHGDAQRFMNSRRSRYVNKVLRFIQRRSDLEKGIAVAVVIILIVLIVHHRTGPSHGLSKEERERRYLARNELAAGRVPSDEAYVTVVTSDKEAIGAFALSASLIHVRSTRMLRILVTPGVSRTVRNQLSNLPNVGAVTPVNPIPSDNQIFATLGTEEWRAHFTKIRVWQLFSFNRLVYLDPQAVVLRNLDSLFQHHTSEMKMFSAYVTEEKFTCSVSGGDVNGIDTSIMVLTPSKQMFGQLVDNVHEFASKAKAPSFNVADVIKKVFEDSGVWMRLSRPGYGLSAHEICQCDNPELQNTARILRDAIFDDTTTVGPTPKAEDENKPSKPQSYGDCMMQYKNQWSRQYQQAKRFLL